MNAPSEGYSIDALASVESEQSLLGGLMLDNRLWDVAGDIVVASDFYREEHREIFAGIAAMIGANKPVDIVTLYEHLGRTIDLPTLHALSQFVPSANNARQYAENIRQRALSRKMLAASSDITALALNHLLPFSDRLEQATGHLVTLMPESATNDWETSEATAVRMLARIDDRANGRRDDVMPTGLDDLDEMLGGGMRPGQLVIVGARPSIGKSALAVSIGNNVAIAGNAVGMFSLEMPADELAERQTAMLSGIHLERIRRSERLRDDDWPAITSAVEQLRTLQFYVCEMAGPNINQVRARARVLKRKHGLQLLIVDYLQLASGTNPKDNRNTQLGEFSRGLKGLAKELGIPIIALAQLGREIEKRTNTRPMLSDLKDSGDIEQDADVILFIDRPIMSNPSLSWEWNHYAEVIVGKQRNGPRGTVALRYVGENVIFRNWEGDKPTRSSTRGNNL